MDEAQAGTHDEAVRHQVISWQGAIGDVVSGLTSDVPFFASQPCREHALMVRRLVEDPRTRSLLTTLAQDVVGVEDERLSARTFAAVAPDLARAGIDLGPVRLPRVMSAWGTRVDVAAARLAPKRTREQATDFLQDLTGIVLSADPDLGERLQHAQEAGLLLDLQPVGIEAIGPSSAQEYAADVRSLLLSASRIERVTLSVAALAPEFAGRLARARALVGVEPGARWDPAPAVELLAQRLRPILRAAREARVEVTLDAPEDALPFTVATVERVSVEPEFLHLPLHLALPVTTSPHWCGLLVAMSQARRAERGAPLGVRLVTGREPREDAMGTSEELTAYLHELLSEQVAGALTITIASDRLEDHAAARVMADQRGVPAPQAFLTAVCPPERSWVLGQHVTTSIEGFVVRSAPAGDAGHSPRARLATVAATARILRASDAARADDAPIGGSRGAPHGSTAVPARRGRPRSAQPPAEELDPADAQVRSAWEEALATAPPAVEQSPMDAQIAAHMVRGCRESAERWSRQHPAQRAAALRRAADLLQHNRTDVLTTGPIATLSNDLAETVDLLREAAAAVRSNLADPLVTDGTTFIADRLVVAIPHPHAPLSGPASAMAAALGAGASIIVIVPPPVAASAQFVAHLMRQALAQHEAPEGLVRVVVSAHVPRELTDTDAVDTVVSADPYLARTIALARSSRPGGPRVLTNPSGPNVAYVGAGAIPEAAAVDLVISAFARGGQAPGSISLALIDERIAASQRFRAALVEAVQALPDLLALDHGVDADLLRALSLDEGEQWWVEPAALDEEQRSWRPGVKFGVQPGSVLTARQVSGPVLGLMVTGAQLPSMAPALTAAFLGVREDHAEAVVSALPATHVSIDRPTVAGAARGLGAQAGAGSSGLDDAGWIADPARLGEWVEDALPARLDEPSDAVRQALIDYTGLVENQADRSWLRAAVGSDAAAWARSLRGLRTRTLPGAVVELRHEPVDLWVRAGQGVPVVELVRVLLAAHAVGAQVRVSLSSGISRELKEMDARGEPARAGLRRLTPLVDRVEDASSFAARVRSGTVSGRVRALGQDADTLPGVLAGRDVELEVTPVTGNGRCELPTYLRIRTTQR